MNTAIEIVTYRPELRAAFEALNMTWLEAHSLLEPVDVEYLQNPETLILANGGQLFFALRDGTAIGTAAAIRVSENTVELAKLAVSPLAQGQGIGRRLSETVIEFARAQGATTVVLTSNTALVQAIRLYESMGFEHQPMPESVPYQTADVYMAFALNEQQK
ncbi:MAG: GNAT family N-acetyltransferase [Acidobacteria bacterium]|nr:GNAT family N-acetyltransferase [Acidobacteriota bacterium]